MTFLAAVNATATHAFATHAFASSAASKSSPDDVQAGVLGFLVVAAIGVVLVFLLRSMNKQFKKIGPKPEEVDDAAAPDALPEDALPPDARFGSVVAGEVVKEDASPRVPGGKPAGNGSQASS